MSMIYCFNCDQQVDTDFYEADCEVNDNGEYEHFAL